MFLLWKLILFEWTKPESLLYGFLALSGIYVLCLWYTCALTCESCALTLVYLSTSSSQVLRIFAIFIKLYGSSGECFCLLTKLNVSKKKKLFTCESKCSCKTYLLDLRKINKTTKFLAILLGMNSFEKQSLCLFHKSTTSKADL